VRLEADPPLPVQFDGDVAGETPIAMELQPGALQVVVPRLPRS
jgi:diacylglycerol kinase family enzyme